MHKWTFCHIGRQGISGDRRGRGIEGSWISGEYAEIGQYHMYAISRFKFRHAPCFYFDLLCDLLFTFNIQTSELYMHCCDAHPCNQHIKFHALLKVITILFNREATGYVHSHPRIPDLMSINTSQINWRYALFTVEVELGFAIFGRIGSNCSCYYNQAPRL